MEIAESPEGRFRAADCGTDLASGAMVVDMVRCVIAGLIVLLLVPAGAGAQESQAPASDPEADSPSGTVYELPLERGRQDAAPRRSPRRKPPLRSGQGSGGGPVSSIRSENQFGSSAQVPGVDYDPAAAGGGQGSSVGGAGAEKGSGPGVVEGAGETARRAASIAGGAGETARSAASIAAGLPANSSSGPSWGLIVPLVALLLLLGVTAGALAGRARRS